MCGKDERFDWRRVGAAAKQIAASGNCKCGCKTGRTRLDKCLEEYSNNLSYLDECGWHFYLPCFITAALDSRNKENCPTYINFPEVLGSVNTNIRSFWENLIYRRYGARSWLGTAPEMLSEHDPVHPLISWSLLTHQQSRAVIEYLKLCFVLDLRVSGEVNEATAGLLGPIARLCLEMQRGSVYGKDLTELPEPAQLKSGLSGDSVLFAVERRFERGGLMLGELVRCCAALSIMRLDTTPAAAKGRVMLDDVRWEQRRLLWIGLVNQLN